MKTLCLCDGTKVCTTGLVQNEKVHALKFEYIDGGEMGILAIATGGNKEVYQANPKSSATILNLMTCMGRSDTSVTDQVSPWHGK